MKLNQELLINALRVLETTELTTADDIKLVVTGVNYLHLITECQTWKALQKNISKSNATKHCAMDELRSVSLING